jgi:hypothetical protein
MSLISGREREARQIRQANRAAAVGRLMLGEFDNWHAFLQADAIDLENLPHRRLKAGRADVKTRLSTEIKNFCSRNFQGMSETKLSRLYEEIKAFRGLVKLGFHSDFSLERIEASMITQVIDTHPEAEEFQILLIRKATVAKRLSLMRSLSQTTIQLSRRAIQRANPTLSDYDLDLAFVAYHYGAELANCLHRYLEQRGYETV